MTGPRFFLPNKTHAREQHFMTYQECWSCGQPANAHCGPADPQPGEVMVCLNCTDPAIVTAGGGLAQPDPQQHAGIIADPTYVSFARVIRAANSQAMKAHLASGEALKDE